jgi:hypothetical protein
MVADVVGALLKDDVRAARAVVQEEKDAGRREGRVRLLAGGLVRLEEAADVLAHRVRAGRRTGGAGSTR